MKNIALISVVMVIFSGCQIIGIAAIGGVGLAKYGIDNAKLNKKINNAGRLTIQRQAVAKKQNIPKAIYCYFGDDLIRQIKNDKSELSKKAVTEEKAIKTLKDDVRKELILCNVDETKKYFMDILKQNGISSVTLNNIRDIDSSQVCFASGGKTYCDGDIINIYNTNLLLRVNDIGNGQVRYYLFLTNMDYQPIADISNTYLGIFIMKRPEPRFNIYSKSFKTYQYKLEEMINKKEGVCEKIVEKEMSRIKIEEVFTTKDYITYIKKDILYQCSAAGTQIIGKK